MKKIAKWMTPFLIVLLLFGCGTNKDKVVEDTKTNDIVPDTANEPADKENDRDIGEINDEVENNVNDKKIEIAEEAADKILEIGEVKSATVLVTNHNAYAAVDIGSNTAEENNGKLEEEVAKKVKETDANIEHVYVSTNPDFFQRMSGYREKINAGEPVEGFFEEFGQAVRNVFPDAK